MGMTGADVLAVSSAGELALSLGRRFTIGWESTGTLARMPLGGAPRARSSRASRRPTGPRTDRASRSCATSGPAAARVPDGPRPLRDGRLDLARARLAGTAGAWRSSTTPAGATTRPRSRSSVADGVARDRDSPSAPRTGWPGPRRGTTSSSPTGSSLTATDLSGRSRTLFRVLGFVMLHDVSAQGRVLVGRTTAQREIVGRAPGESRDRGLSWLDWSFPTALSDDGRFVLFEEQNLGNEYGLFLRRTDGAPPVRLGDGRGLALSPDGRWVLADPRRSTAPNELVLLPTGAGETRRVGRPAVVAQGAAFLPGGERVVISGHTPSAGGRLFTYDLATSALSPISPEGVTSYFNAMVSPDGKQAFATGPDGKLTLYPVDGGEPRVVPGTSTRRHRDPLDGRRAGALRPEPRGPARPRRAGGRRDRRAAAVAGAHSSRSRRRAEHRPRPPERGREGLRVLLPPQARPAVRRGGPALAGDTIAIFAGTSDDITPPRPSRFRCSSRPRGASPSPRARRRASSTSATSARRATAGPSTPRPSTRPSTPQPRRAAAPCSSRRAPT